jgi:hypothetical protein
VTTIGQVEKFAVYYCLKTEALTSPRQLRDFIRSAVLRLSSKDTRLRYDHLFEAGNRKNQIFFAENQAIATELSGVFLRLANGKKP